jgi:hypothetical protein
MVALVKQLREVFVIQTVMEKPLSRFFKIHFIFPIILPRKRRAEQEKNGF